MHISGEADKPIFQQIAEEIENAILSGAFLEEEQIPSITDFSVRYTINPATALKGITMLVDENILYKKRGVGMFVQTGALQALRQKRHSAFKSGFVEPFVAEAKRLGIPHSEASAMMDEAFAEN